MFTREVTDQPSLRALSLFPLAIGLLVFATFRTELTVPSVIGRLSTLLGDVLAVRLLAGPSRFSEEAWPRALASWVSAVSYVAVGLVCAALYSGGRTSGAMSLDNALMLCAFILQALIIWVVYGRPRSAVAVLKQAKDARNEQATRDSSTVKQPAPAPTAG